MFEPDPAPQAAQEHPRRAPKRAWGRAGLVAFVVIFALQFALPQPIGEIPLPIWTRAPLALVAGYGLSLPLVILWLNRARWRAMLRFRLGRGVAAVLMAGFTPLWIWGPLPAVIGFFTLLSGVSEYSPSLFLALLIVPILLAYTLASALIYGLPRRWRISALVAFNFGQMALVAGLGLVFSGKL